MQQQRWWQKGQPALAHEKRVQPAVAAKQDQQLKEVMEQLAKLGGDVETDAEVGKAFDVNYLNKIVD